MDTEPRSEIADQESKTDLPLLSRPDEQRLREYKYRFGQAFVFGLPVLALHVYGRSLGTAESPRWVGLFQALLAGWVLYVVAGGMLFEGLLWLLARRRVTVDLLVAGVAAGLYVWGVLQLPAVLFSRHPPAVRTLYHVQVTLLALWSAVRWRHLARKLKAAG